MATNTTNYNFKKPDESDFYSVQDQNNNWDKADTALKNLDTPTFEDYSGSTTAPDAATAINNIKSKGKLSTILSNMKAAFKGACLIGQIVNNCVTNNAKLPLSAAQGKALMDLYTQLNSDLGGLAAKIEVQQKNNIDICTLSTGLYYCVNCKNMPPQWVGCYLQVMRLDSNWCYMIAYEPYNGTNAIATTKCYEGTWSGWIQRAQ